MSEIELNSISIMDEYDLGNFRCNVFGYDIEVKDTLLGEALRVLTEKKRNIILLAYFTGIGNKGMLKDLDSLESLLDSQMKGEEGILEYYSYWWISPDLERVKKISA